MARHVKRLMPSRITSDMIRERDEIACKHKAQFCEPVFKIFDKAPKIVREAGRIHGETPVRDWYEFGILPRRIKDDKQG